mgnify:CR=1 FL=1
MIGPISAYGANSFISPYASYTATPAASAEGISPAGKADSAGQTDAASNQSPDAIRKGECPTCENRKYVDGSDEMVSFKAPTKINPRAAASSVRAHEQEHVSNAFAKASKMEGGKVLQALGDAQVGSGAVQHTHLDQGEEPNHQAVQALGAGQQLQHHDLTGFGGILTQKTGAGLTGDTGTSGRTHTGQSHSQAGTKQGQRHTTKCFEETHANILLNLVSDLRIL